MHARRISVSGVSCEMLSCDVNGDEDGEVQMEIKRIEFK